MSSRAGPQAQSGFKRLSIKKPRIYGLSRKHAVSFCKLMTGIEPVTSSLPMRCATDCATPAYLVYYRLTLYPFSEFLSIWFFLFLEFFVFFIDLKKLFIFRFSFIFSKIAIYFLVLKFRHPGHLLILKENLPVFPLKETISDRICLLYRQSRRANIIFYFIFILCLTIS